MYIICVWPNLCGGWRTTLGVHSLLPPCVIGSGDQIWSDHETCAQLPLSTEPMFLMWVLGTKLGSPSLCGKHFVNPYTALKHSCVFGCYCWNTKMRFHRGSCRLYLRRKGLGVGPWLHLLNSRREQASKLGRPLVEGQGSSRLQNRRKSPSIHWPVLTDSSLD